MATEDEVKEKVRIVLERLWNNHKNKGLLSIYLWGSIITPDFNPRSSDIDAVGILSEDADFNAFDQIRQWLPSAEPSLRRLQINFFYLSELKGGSVRSRLGRLHNAEQAVFDFPHWLYVCGERYTPRDFPKVSPQRALQHQINVVKERKDWAINPKEYYGSIGLEYYCKSLAWLCYNIHKLAAPASSFSWSELDKGANDDTKSLVAKLQELKNNKWNRVAIKKELPFLFEQSDKLVQKYS